MALADRRPLGLPVAAAPALPAFNPKTLGVSGLPPSPGSPAALPTLRSILPDSLVNGRKPVLLVASLRGLTPPAPKKPKNPLRAPIATGISTTIPVTGEKPRPDRAGDPLLDDDVLYAIFAILYERDRDGKGMTVKQICDVLVENHPSMANLSTKTSNLVSAKLNAYVKRVEKGDANLKYALSRDWADALPKRMVYVYRGLLAADFHVHVKSLQPAKDLVDDDDALAAGKQALLKPRRQTMFDLGIKHTFDAPERADLVVPYASAPVTASLNELSLDSDAPENADVPDPRPPADAAADSDLDSDLDVLHDDADFLVETLHKNGKRSKSMSALLSKKPKVLTAAAAAPRASRAPCSHSPNAAAAAAALHAAALQAISSSAAGGGQDTAPACRDKCKWMTMVRSGFLTQEIGAPEDTSLLDLDKFFG